MKAILVLKRFDLEQIAMAIKPEKDRLAYNEEKKRAIAAKFRQVHEELSELRARLIPPKDIDLEAERLNFITTNVDNMLSGYMDGFEYDVIKTELEEKVRFYSFICFEEKFHVYKLFKWWILYLFIDERIQRWFGWDKMARIASTSSDNTIRIE